mmetsp:Transcript_60396/g.123213  ORF Transcript_60396/g.123213 Transcript_60396/m.123213 type:complete len:82 (+) Transcript_60396:57-302(+)
MVVDRSIYETFSLDPTGDGRISRSTPLSCHVTFSSVSCSDLVHVLFWIERTSLLESIISYSLKIESKLGKIFQSFVRNRIS